MSSETQKQNNDQQKIVAGFQKLREQQQTTVAEVGRIQTELREHTTVLATVKDMEPDRKCFRQVGDTLFEYKAVELVTILEEMVAKFKERVAELEAKTVEVGNELNAYKTKNNIRLLSEKEVLEIQKRQALSKVTQLASK